MEYDKKALVTQSLEELAAHNNIAEFLDKDTLNKIGAQVVQEYNADESSRSDWLKRYKRNLELATQTEEIKSHPWPNASNVKYPLLLNAGLQFHARAFPALIPGAGIVTGKVIGKDEMGIKKVQAERIAAHMSYQLTDEMTGWEEGMDRLLITLPFTGTEFKKTYFDSKSGHNVSEHVFAKDLVVNYYAKSIELAPRITEILSYSKNELIENHREGIFLDCGDDFPVPRNDTALDVQNKSKGINPPPQHDSSTAHVVLEQHRYYDLDGDGYEEPYICTVLKSQQKVLRIVAAYYPEGISYDGGVVKRIERISFYTVYIFIPNPAGGIYGIAFGDLLGPLNHSVDTIINQLIDAGTLSNLQPGFISRSLRIKGGNYRLTPGNWMTVNATGQDIKQGVLPLPTPIPSQTLFNLLQFLIGAGERVSSTTDLQVGENPGQNQKVGTTKIVQENGLKVFTAIYKRLRSAMESEFLKLFKLNKLYVKPRDYFSILQPTQREMQYIEIKRTDYQTDDINIIPSADPYLASQEMKMARAQFLAGMVPMGGFNEYEVKRRLLEAGDIERIDELLPPPGSPNEVQPQPNPDLMKLQLEAIREDNEEKEREFRRNYDTQKLQMEAHAKGIDLVIKDKEATIKAMKVQGEIVNDAANITVKARSQKSDNA